jgi:hypothetical protein
VREALAIWREDYNTVRPHSALANLPPATYAKLTGMPQPLSPVIDLTIALWKRILVTECLRR